MKRGSIVYLKKFPKDIVKPYVVVSNDKCNEVSPTISVVPLSRQHSRLDLPTHCIVTSNQSMAKCEEIHTVLKDNIERVVFVLNESEMCKIDECLRIALGL